MNGLCFLKKLSKAACFLKNQQCVLSQLKAPQKIMYYFGADLIHR